MKKNENVIVRKSGSSGFGLFANKNFKRGNRIIEYTGELISNKEADKRGGMYLFNLTGKFVIDGVGRKNIARYANHSCRPNAVAYQSGKKRAFIYARRKIEKGEEILYDYGRAFFDGFLKGKCKCGHCDGKGKVKRK